MGAMYGVPCAPVAPQRSLVQRAAGRAHRVVESRTRRVGLTRSPVVAEKMARVVRLLLGAQFKDGYHWHQERLASMPCVREYVCRPDFVRANAALPSEATLA
jgi:hypothetical protein